MSENINAVMEFPPNYDPTEAELRQRYRRLASGHHPDRAGGSDTAMSELNVALAEAEREIG